jgi:hypothetical protein
MVALMSLAACGLVDAPPEVVPVEVVAVDQDDDRRCTLGRRSMTAGSHETFLLAEGGPAEIRILAEGGTVVFGARVDPRSGSTNHVDFGAGSYRVECAWPDGERRSVELTVVPSG